MNTAGQLRGWIVTGWIFTLLYLVISYAQFTANPGPEHVPVGLAILAAAVLLGTGAHRARQGNFKVAKICWIVGGILSLPLGVVMLIGGIRIGKPAPSGAGTVTDATAVGTVKCPACSHEFTPPRITLATEATIARYGPNPVQCPGCRHIWSRR